MPLEFAPRTLLWYIFHMSGKDDSTIDLSGLDDLSTDEDGDDSLKDISGAEEEFQIHHLDAVGVEAFGDFDKLESAKSGFSIGSLRPTKEDEFAPRATDKVKVKFDKFITLVATHTYEDILKKNADEDVIISTNLLTDLANAHSDEGNGIVKKIPIIFVGGLVVGVIVAWLLMRG